MSRFFSPFRNAKGEQKVISEVTYRDIQKLINENISEGFFIDYKSQFDFNCKTEKTRKKFRDDFCEDVCSFANNDGGWIIYGIGEDNENKKIISLPIDKEKCHVDIQPISEVLKVCSPLPNIETKFISMPKDKKKGYFIVYVYEGLFPPYIANGKIKTRIGSSSESIFIKKRSELDFLYEKQNQKQKEQDDFFVYENFYPPTRVVNHEKKFEMPMLNIGVKSDKQKEIKTYKDIEELVEKIEKEIPNSKCQVGLQSILILSSKQDFSYNRDNPSKTAKILVPVIAELFYDYSFKFHFPLIPTSEKEKMEVIEKMPCTMEYEFQNFSFINGSLIFNYVLEFFKVYLSILKENSIQTRNFLLNCKLQHISNLILYINKESYFDYVYEKGLRISYHDAHEETTLFSNYFRLKDFGAEIGDFILQKVLLAFGYMPYEIKEIYGGGNQ